MILVAGEALYDLVVQGDGDDLRGHPGGGPFNTARTVGRLGQPVAYLGRVSSDRFGRRLEALLADDGVALESVVRTDEPTTLAIAEVDHEGVARYRFYERGTAATGLTPEAALDALPDAVDVLHVGTLGLALEPVATALEAVVERVADSALIAVDPNCRPWVIEDPAAYRSRLDRVLARAHLLKVSEEDIEYLEPGRLAGRGRARAARARADRRPAHARPERRARDHPDHRGRGPGAACQGGRHDRRR